MARSIRRRIQWWNSIVLLAVVASFGTLLYVRLRMATLQEIDIELQGAAQVLVTALRAVPSEEFEHSGPRQLSLPIDWQRESFRPPPEHKHGPPRPRDERHPPHEKRPPSDHQRERPPYYLIWKRSGDLIASSPAAPTTALPATAALLTEAMPLFQSRRDIREVLLAGPEGTTVLVGRAIDREVNDLGNWLLLIVGSGAALVAIGTIGGIVLSHGSLRSIRTMSSTAAAISASNLSERIDTKAIDSELADLAQTFNGAFARIEGAFVRQTQFTSDASHELRTPLTIILGNLELELARPELPAESRAALEASLRAARRMKALVEHLLLLARADAGGMTIDRQSFDLSETTQECVDLLKPLADERQVTLHCETEPAELLGDPRLLAQVVINLVTNAIQYNRPGGEVRVQISGDERQIELTVADTGIGIPVAYQDRLFERFFRLDAARSRDSGGSGLGLAIAHSILKSHGGQITVVSEVDRGTTFRIILPRE